MITRENAKYYYVDGYGYSKIKSELEKTIDELFDAFESRTCQNCKHYNNTDEFFGGKCKPKNVNMDKDDGCLKGWEDGKQI